MIFTKSVFVKQYPALWFFAFFFFLRNIACQEIKEPALQTRTRAFPFLKTSTQINKGLRGKVGDKYTLCYCAEKLTLVFKKIKGALFF